MDPITDPTTAAVAGWSLWVWVSLGLVAAAAVVGGLIHYRTHRDALGAVQASIEIFMGKLASRGMAIEANELGATVGETVSKAGVLVKRLNDKHHKKTKAKLMAAHPEGKSTREIIAEAFRRERPVQPDDSVTP